MRGKLKNHCSLLRILAVVGLFFGGVLFVYNKVLAAPPILANTPWPTLGQNQKRTYKSPNPGPAIKPDSGSVSSIDIGSIDLLNYPPVIGTDGTIYIVGDYNQLPDYSFTANLIALDPNTLNRKWTRSLSPDANSRCSVNETRLYLVGSPVVARKGSQDIIYVWELNYDIFDEQVQCQVLLAFEENGTRHRVFLRYITSPVMIHWNEDFNPAVALGSDGTIYFKTESRPGGEPNTTLYIQAIQPTESLDNYILLWRSPAGSSSKPAGVQYPSFDYRASLSLINNCVVFTVTEEDHYTLDSRGGCGIFTQTDKSSSGLGFSGDLTPLIHPLENDIVYWLPGLEKNGNPTATAGELYKLDFSPSSPPSPSWQYLDFAIEKIAFGADIISFKQQDFPLGGAVDNINNIYKVDKDGILYGPWDGGYNLGTNKPGYTIIDLNKTLWITSGSKLFRVKEGKDFSLTAQTPITAYPTDTKTSTITITSLNGFNQNVDLTATPSNACLTIGFSQNPVVGGSGTSTLTINTTNCAVGNHTITVQGDGPGGNPSHQTTITVQVGVTLTVGNTSGYAWSENIGWLSLNCDHTSLGLPLGATNCVAQGGVDYGVLAGNTELSGFAWGENIGWISLNCSNDASCGTVDYKVTNNNGVLDGYAWGEQIGWIDFNPVGDEGVVIDVATGVFSGYAWGEIVGWISFGDGANYRGETTWRGILGQLSKPTNVRHTNNPEGPPRSITWVWDAVDIPGAPGKQASYVIYMKEINPGECIGGFCTSANFVADAPSIIISADYLDRPLSFNTQYTIKVMAVYTGYANSDFSDPPSFAYTSAASAITLSGTVFSNSQINWTWQSGGGNSGFYARNAQGGSKGWTADLFWNQAGLGCGISYTLQVKAKNADYNNCAAANGCASDDFICMESKCPGDATGWKDSNSVIIETLTAPSNAELPEANITAASMRLTWVDNATNEEGFKIERAEGEIAPGIYNQVYDTKAPDIVLYDDSGLAQNTRYWYKVKAYSSIACDSGYVEANAWTKGPKIVINPITYPVGNIDYNYNFGALAPGGSKSVAMLICNLGEIDLTVSSASISPIGDFSFAPPGSSFTLGVDPIYNNCDNNLAAIAKKELVIKFTAPLICDPGPVASQADFILLNSDADKIVSLRGVCQEPPVGEGQSSENIIYDGRIMANPPPAFVEFLKKLQILEKIKPR